jgi:hypothetical protein
MSSVHYRNSKLGELLIETLDEMVYQDMINEEKKNQILTIFDMSMID